MVGNRTASALWNSASRSGKVGAILTGLILSLLLSFSGPSLQAFAAVISQQLRDEAGISVLFEDLLTFPQEYRGRVVILGGYILEIQSEPGGSVLTVIQAPLDWRNEPKSPDLSQGRFFVTADRFLDPEVYVKGRRITVGGRVAGVRKQSVGGATYRFPTIEAQELHLWPKKTHPVPPYYPSYDPWYDPWYPWGYSYPWRDRYPY
ncbi:MAG TPA: Slp/YeaY family lipoprotein [Syntrophobacteria bacterium]|nr:Slp/YeaY family lipoprotein [Syntrophobacteria bacterium]